MTKELKLKVTEALPKDTGRGYARIDPSDMAKLNLAVGDIIQVTSSKGNGIAKLMPTYIDLRGKGIVQLDGLTRRNAGLSLDEKAVIEPVTCKHATRIVLIPTTITPNPRDLDYIGSLLDGLPVKKGDLLRAHLFGSRSAEFKVESTVPEGAVLINPTTALVIGNSKETKNAGAGAQRLSYEDVGGLRGQVRRIREMIELPLRYPEVFERLGIDAPKGVLLTGPPGCGKTLIARIIAQETDAQFFTISGLKSSINFTAKVKHIYVKFLKKPDEKAPVSFFLMKLTRLHPIETRLPVM